MPVHLCCGWVIADLSREKHSINLFRHRNLREVQMICRCFIDTETGSIYRVDNSKLPVKVYKYVPDLKEWVIIKGIIAKRLRAILGY